MLPAVTPRRWRACAAARPARAGGARRARDARRARPAARRDHRPADQRRRVGGRRRSSRCSTTSSTSRTARGCSQSLDTPGEIAAAVAIVLAAGYLLSFLAAIVVFAGFEVERDAQVLRIRRGLLSQRALSIPLGASTASSSSRACCAGRSDSPRCAWRAPPTAASGRPGARCCRSCAAPRRRPSSRGSSRRCACNPASSSARRAARCDASSCCRRWPAPSPAPWRRWRCRGLARDAALALAGALSACAATAPRRPPGGRRRRRARGAPGPAHPARPPPPPAGAPLARTPLQARAALADLRVTVGSGGQGRARHLERAAAEAAFRALRPVPAPAAAPPPPA